MSEPENKVLNPGQQKASDGFFAFLLNDEKELIISGAGGVGKTYLMGYLIDEIIPRYYNTCSMMGIKPQYHSVHMTATTNKAAEVLGETTDRPACTIHSFLGLRVKENYTTGRTNLQKTPNWKVHEKEIIFIDECSMIDNDLYAAIQEGACNSKIVYVGDHSQLPPVFEDISPIYKNNISFFELTESMRNASQPALRALCDQVRATVATGIFKPIQTVPGVIDWLDEDEILAAIDNSFVKKDTNSRILAYSNSTVNELNNYIRQAKNLPGHYIANERLVSNSALQYGSTGISVEEPVKILSMGSKTTYKLPQDLELEVHYADLLGKFGQVLPNVPIPVNKAYFEQLVKYFAKQKDWPTYFTLKNTFPDLRPHTACTVHKSQGSSYDTVFIDLNSLSTCNQSKLAARLLYVAVTRPMSRIIMYGKLADKYGGVI